MIPEAVARLAAEFAARAAEHDRDVLCSRVHWPQDDLILRRAGRAALER